MNGIWNLPKLTHCHLGLSFVDENYFISSTVLSLSLKYLTISDVLCYRNEINRLVTNTPNLRYLFAHVNTTDKLEHLTSSFLWIKTLKLVWNGIPTSLTNLLIYTPHVSCLTVETTTIDMNGYQWENIISTYLPKLKTFQLKMDVNLDSRSETIEEFHCLFNTFTTSFWIHERQWFVRCDCYPQRMCSVVYLYTLPYAFDTFHIYPTSFGMLSLSTSPNIEDHRQYDRVRTLVYDSSFNDEIMFHLVFPNVNHLVLNLPYSNYLFSILLRLDRLLSLNVTLYEPDILSQLQSLFRRAPHLHSLSIASFNHSSSPWLLLQSASASVKQIDLQGFIPSNTDFCFNQELCAQLIQSPLAANCEALSIQVENRSNIIDLVNNMVNLRTLGVHSHDDPWKDCRKQISIEEDELVSWLKVRLPSSCTIFRDPNVDGSLRLWIR